MLRVVLDTNIIVSGLISKLSAPADILDAWYNREFVLVLSPEIIDEIERVLAYPKIAKKYSLTAIKQQRIIALLKKYAVMVEPQTMDASVSVDPTDDKFLACAVAGRADHIVSGDSHLLDMKTYRFTEIITGARFLVVLEETSRRIT